MAAASKAVGKKWLAETDGKMYDFIGTSRGKLLLRAAICSYVSDLAESLHHHMQPSS